VALVEFAFVYLFTLTLMEPHAQVFFTPCLILLIYFLQYSKFRYVRYGYDLLFMLLAYFFFICVFVFVFVLVFILIYFSFCFSFCSSYYLNYFIFIIEPGVQLLRDGGFEDNTLGLFDGGALVSAPNFGGCGNYSLAVIFYILFFISHFLFMLTFT
jgi:hypothetical protein